jgi:hypothetical protein
MQSLDNSGSPSPASPAGQPLPQDVRLTMQQRMHADFRDVRVHPGVMNVHTLQAGAFTQGNNIAFAPGAYHPHTQQGQELLGHELAHVVQQSNVAQKR